MGIYLEIVCRLYDVIDDLLDINIGIAGMAEVVAEIFIGRPELCLKVREDQIAKVFTLIAKRDQEDSRPALLFALQSMAKVERPLISLTKHNTGMLNCHDELIGGEFKPHSEEKPGIYRNSLF